MQSSTERVKEVPVIFWDFFEHLETRKFEEDTNSSGCYFEGSESITIIVTFAKQGERTSGYEQTKAENVRRSLNRTCNYQGTYV